MTENKIPVVIYGGHKYINLDGLLNAIPHIANSKLLELCYLVSFFYGGSEYEFIENIDDFKEKYLNVIEFDKNSLDYNPDRLIDHGEFNIRVMHSPRIVDNELVFFVQNIKSKLPYRVSCPYPIPSGKMDVTFHLLPYADP